MKIEKQIRIKNKVFQEEDICRLAQLFLDLVEEEHDSVKFEVKCKGGITLTGDTLDMFSSDYFRIQEVKEMIFRAYLNNVNRIVRVTLCNPAWLDCDFNSFCIEGEDSQWLDRTCGVFERYFESVRRQSFFARLIEYPYCIASGCSMYAIIFAGVSLLYEKVFVNVNEQFMLEEAIAYALLSLPILGLLSLICVPLIKWCYPSVEFRFGNKNDDGRLRFRKAILWIGGTIIIPILLSLISK